jgi:hypothetical protein
MAVESVELYDRSQSVGFAAENTMFFYQATCVYGPLSLTTTRVSLRPINGEVTHEKRFSSETSSHKSQLSVKGLRPMYT